MITGLKPYSEYKHSGHIWLDKIPFHWGLLPNRALFYEVIDKNHPEEEMLSVTIARGIIRQKSLLADTSKKDSSNLNKASYKLVQPDDIAYNKMRAWQGAVGVSAYRGIISPAYVVMRLRNDENRAVYFHNLFRTPQFAKEAERWSYGITSDMWSLRPEHFKMIYAPEPPPDEQKAIVKFLNWANGRLEKAIRAKRKIIALLNEQKQAIIHRAVTRGLDPNVPLKPSGIPWLGDIPQHWEIVRNMAIFAQRIEQGIPGFPVLQVSLHSGITAEEVDQFGRPKRLIADVTKYKLLRRGDLAYNTMRMWQGAVGVAPFDGLVSPAYVVIKPRIDICPKFYEFFFRTECYKQQINRQSTGIVSDRNRLYWDSFKQMPNLKIPMFEQEKIVEFIFAEVSGLNKAVRSAEQEICFLREFRTRLVADVVTGKLDIREAAAGLPKEETNEPEEIFEDIETTEEEFENEQE